MLYSEAIVEYKDDIISRFEPARVLKNALTTKQVEEIMLYQFQNSDKIRWTDTSNNLQPTCNMERMFRVLPWLQNLFENEIEPFADSHSGNFYITTQLHDIHADLLTEKEVNEHEDFSGLIPYKSCVIPLAIGHNASASTAFFDQRHIGFSITLDRNYQSLQDNSLYEISREYPDFYMMDGSISPQATYDPRGEEFIFPHVDNENLDGLTIESVFDFTPGDIMLFDSCQLHCSCVPRERPNFTGLKNGINIQFYREV
jgi:hypothetical protein